MPLFKVNSFFYFHLVHGNQHQVHGCLRLRPTHQDGEPDSDLHHDGLRPFLLSRVDRCLRGSAVRLQGRSQPRRGDCRCGCRCRRILEHQQFGTPYDQAQLRPRLLRRALHQGHGNRSGRGQAHESIAPRSSSREPAVHGGEGAGQRTSGNPGSPSCFGADERYQGGYLCSEEELDCLF